jgi:hypothetical protein
VCLAVDGCGEVAALDELHDEVHVVVRGVVDHLPQLHAVRVLQLLHHADLLEHAVQRRARALLLLGEH